MERRLFDDLVVSGNGAARAPSFKTLPFSLAVHAAALALLASLSVTAVTEVTAPAGPIVFPLSPRPGPRVVPANRNGPSRAPRGEQRPLVVADPQPSLVPDATPQDSDILTPASDSPICLSGCSPGDPAGTDTTGTTGPGGTGGTGEGPGDGAGAIRRVGGDIREPRRIRGAAPPYPELARRAQVEGKVVLECVIDTDGRVADLRVMTGHPLLASAALDAVRRWEYIPTRLNGQPVRVILTVTVRFTLDRR
jgi:protein TonB